MLAVPPRYPCDPLTGEPPIEATYDHSPAAQLTAIRDSGGAQLIGYNYDGFGRMTRIDRANGLSTSFDFDPVSRLSRLTHQQLLHTDFTYNPASQIATRALSNGNWAWDEGINVDLDYEVNNLNQYTEVGTTDFAYDLNGNLADDGPNTYAYDPENRMKWSSDAGGIRAQLRYDGRGRLRRRWGSGSGTTDYVYDGDAMIAEYNDATGAVLRRYIHGAGVDDPLIWYEGSGTGDRRFLHADERGSITTVTNNAGGIIARNIYDEWGVPGAGNIGRFQYTGQQWLPELGLYYYKARFYAPGIGRFMQTDPIGYEDGMNLYAYVGNDPMNGADHPTGREAGCITLGGNCTDPNLTWEDVANRALTLVDVLAVGFDIATGPSGEGGAVMAITGAARASIRSLAVASRANRLISRIGNRFNTLNRRHYRAARTEARGGVTSTRQDGPAHDHINDIREQAQGLRNDLRNVQRELRRGDLSDDDADRLRQTVRRGEQRLDEAEDVLRRARDCTGTRICSF